MLKIFGNPMSTCTRKVMMTAAETNTPFEMSVIDLAKGEHKQPLHLGRQPFGRVPAIQDDGFEMFESRAICRYVDEKAKGKLVPSDLKARALMEQWISVETGEFSPHAIKFVFHYMLKREQEPAALEAAGKGLETCCAVLDRALAKSPFLAGADFSLADVSFMPAIEYTMLTPAKDILASCRHLMSWWHKVSERPTWRKVTGKG